MRADALRRRAAIINTASRLLRTHGDDVTLERIAAEAQVGIATLYRNFPDKTSLILACATHLADEFVERQRKLISAMEFQPAEAADHVRAYADALLSMELTIAIPAFVPSDLYSLPPALAVKRDELKRNGDRFVELAQRLNEIGPEVTHLEIVVGLLTLARPLKVGVAELQPDIQDRMVDLYLAGIGCGH